MSSLGGDRVLQEGFGRRVVLEAHRGTIRKTFHDGLLEERRALARDEFDRLQRYRVALADLPGTACPRPLEVLDDPPGLRMERVPGRSLFVLLAGPGLSDAARAQVAHAIAQAILVYARTFGEPVPDLNLLNVLYEPSTETVAFIDLGLPQDHVPPPSGTSPLEAALGDLLGSTVYLSVRPRDFLHRRCHRAAAELCAEVVAHAAALDGDGVRDARLRQAAAAAYRRCAYGRGLVRAIWFAGVGVVLGTRMQTDAGRIGPVLPAHVGR